MIINSNGILTANSWPDWTPEVNDAKVVRLANTFVLGYWDGNQWLKLMLNEHPRQVGVLITQNSTDNPSISTLALGMLVNNSWQTTDGLRNNVGDYNVLVFGTTTGILVVDKTLVLATLGTDSTPMSIKASWVDTQSIRILTFDDVGNPADIEGSAQVLIQVYETYPVT